MRWVCRLVGSLDLLDATYAGPDMVTDCSKIYQAEVRPCTPSQRRIAAGQSCERGCVAAGRMRRGPTTRIRCSAGPSQSGKAPKLVRKTARGKTDAMGFGRRVATSGPEAVESVLVQVVVLDDLIEEDDKRVDVAEVRRPSTLCLAAFSPLRARLV